MSSIKPSESEVVDYSGIEIPTTEEEIVELMFSINSNSEKDGQLLPDEYFSLESQFSNLYGELYTFGVGTNIKPPELDFLFQEYCIKMDERLGQNGVNTFGMYGLSYFDALNHIESSERFLRRAERTGKKPRVMMLGCSSISSMKEFSEFTKAVNPQSVPIVVDVNRIPILIARRLGVAAQQIDAQNPQFEEGMVDMICTNFLLKNLEMSEGTNADTAIKKILESAAKLLRPEQGRLVMVEDLNDDERLNVSDIANSANLTLADRLVAEMNLDINRQGTLNSAVRLKNRSDISKLNKTIAYETSRKTNSNATPILRRNKKTYEGIEYEDLGTNAGCLIFSRQSDRFSRTYH